MIRQEKHLTNHVTVVSGGSGGIGTSVCHALLALGATVISVYHGPHSPVLSSNGIIQLRANLQSPEEWRRLIRTVIDRFGIIDSLIHCSGMLVPGTVLSLSEDQIRAIVEVNFLSLIHGCRAVLPFMRRQQRGHIITIGSLGGVLPMPYESVYSATKFALRGFTLSLNEELRETGIHCSVISSGPVATRMLDEEARDKNSAIAFMTSPIQPSEIAKIVLELLRHPKPEVMVPRTAALSSRLLAFNPRLFGLIFRFLTPYGQHRRLRYIHDRSITLNA